MSNIKKIKITEKNLANSKALYTFSDRLLLKKGVKGRQFHLEEQDHKDLQKFVNIYNALSREKKINVEQLGLSKSLTSKETFCLILKIFFNSFLLERGTFKMTGKNLDTFGKGERAKAREESKYTRIQYHTGKFSRYDSTLPLNVKNRAITTSFKTMAEAFDIGSQVGKVTMRKIYALLEDLGIIQHKQIIRVHKGGKMNRIRLTKLTPLGKRVVLQFIGKDYDSNNNLQWNALGNKFFRLRQKIDTLYKKNKNMLKACNSVRHITKKYAFKIKRMYKKILKERKELHKYNFNTQINQKPNNNAFYICKVISDTRPNITFSSEETIYPIARCLTRMVKQLFSSTEKLFYTIQGIKLNQVVKNNMLNGKNITVKQKIHDFSFKTGESNKTKYKNIYKILLTNIRKSKFKTTKDLINKLHREFKQQLKTKQNSLLDFASDFDEIKHHEKAKSNWKREQTDEIIQENVEKIETVAELTEKDFNSRYEYLEYRVQNNLCTKQEMEEAFELCIIEF